MTHFGGVKSASSSHADQILAGGYGTNSPFEKEVVISPYHGLPWYIYLHLP